MQTAKLATSTKGTPGVRRATSRAASPRLACQELAATLGNDNATTFVFVGDGYDFEEVDRELTQLGPGPVVASSTSGIVGEDGYCDSGMSAIAFKSSDFEVTNIDIPNALDYSNQLREVRIAADAILSSLEPDDSAFAILLVDGLSRAEERLTAALFHVIGDMQLMGGSAGDHLRFERTLVRGGSGFRTGAGVVSLVKTKLPISIFRHQHHVPTGNILVVTSCDPESRIVYTMNGAPAAEAYAAAVGIPVDVLRANTELFASHPIVMRAGSRNFIRSVQTIGPESSLQFSCAVDAGIVLRTGEPREPIKSLKAALASASEDVGGADSILTFDCALRKEEFIRSGTDSVAGKIMAAAGAVGFSTYGEQIDALHVNQTLVGVAIGSR